MNTTIDISRNEKIYGTRICPVCKGICHKNSIRRKYGARKTYYCSRLHLASALNDRLTAHMRKAGYYKSYSYTDEEIDELIEKHFEYVDVIS